MAFAGLAAGWDYGPFILSPLAALLCLVLIYLAGRELGLSRVLSSAGAMILALCPVFLFQAEQPIASGGPTRRGGTREISCLAFRRSFSPHFS